MTFEAGGSYKATTKMEQPPGETRPERRNDLLERLVLLERVVEMALDAKNQRVSALENVVNTALQGKGGVLDRLEHVDACIDGLKKTVWMATGAIMFVSLIANWLTRHT